MEKRIAAIYSGSDSRVGELKVNRLLPNRYKNAVGPFVFLDHLYPHSLEANSPAARDGKFAHPHRGIATFSYLFSGELEHYDSMGNHGIVTAGGAQWMNAGNGIIHDERASTQFRQKGGVLHALQFWINLPSKNKAEKPGYFGLQSEDVPKVDLETAGKLRVLIGEFEGKASPVERFTDQFIYHISLNPESEYVFRTKPGLEYAACIPQNKMMISGKELGPNELLTFGKEGSDIGLKNTGTLPADLILFGGEPYTEDIVAEGPFVMNSRIEIAEAYKDFFNGKYGEITYR
ncbi:pirin family protein [Pedobacter sp. P351]|uniref:pirin family protein n=1 Tax=Pedobacter superstes TaxID=3133441 RepID=UPI0030A61633